MKRLVVGILAHVDAGKTTLSEGMLYRSGKIRRLGRVDHRDTYLDTDPMERERGITIFSKQARMTVGETEIVLLDTPGHTDFSAEAERTLSVLDYAILVISGSEGVQNHTLTLWQLLRTYRVPTFLFINKMDLPTRGEAALAESLSARLRPGCVPFFTGESASARNERLAMADETLLELYLESGELDRASVAGLIAARRVFPCFFGSALRLEGVDTLLDALDTLTLAPVYPDRFGAQVYKIVYDGSGGASSRLTCLKVTGGSLAVRDEITYPGPDGKPIAEKVAQLRRYSGDRFTPADRVEAGEICTAVGLSATRAGMGLGDAPDAERPVLEPVLDYRICLPEGCDPMLIYPRLCRLEEEDPALHLRWDELHGDIYAGLMGEVQIEVLQRRVAERLGIDITVDAGRIIYRETIAEPVEGIGHFEPLRHYAEVHLWLEPLPAGSGLIFDTRCPEDLLARNWQRLILTHLAERTHRGVLTGAPLTDVKITLLCGRAHLKHTDGGDFREAVGRAVRQGLMQAKSILLEPYYRYRLTLPASCVGRAMRDMQTRGATVVLEDGDGEESILCGRMPVAGMRDYLREMLAYTHGLGNLWCTFDGYAPCADQAAAVAAADYNPDHDLANPSHSVFCAHGGGFTVPWDRVREHMHLDSGILRAQAVDEPLLPSVRTIARQYQLDDDELEAIMLRTFGPVKRRQYTPPRVVGGAKPAHAPKPKTEALLVDGYNVIFAWDFLKSMAEASLEGARDALIRLLDNYAGFTHSDVTVVFDAYNVEGGAAHEEQRERGCRVVYTAQHETADAYIERFMHEAGASMQFRVVTSDRLIQLSAVHAGVLRLSAREFYAEILRVNAEIGEFIRQLTADS
ncbi:MAG: TetM/TetW/TetO/TetS family tetracycline resistance ribosomal protection protein [Clostridia bacterium]|nr:TetM/TetW/TetO/TetS family tetracycline resistance ribosomal protection protein [Clostridia bacterium]